MPAIHSIFTPASTAAIPTAARQHLPPFRRAGILPAIVLKPLAPE